MKSIDFSYKTKVHIVMLLYWILLITWQTLRPVSNRSIVDVIIKCCLLIIPVLYSLTVSKDNNKYKISSLLLLAFFIGNQMITVFLNESVLSLSVLVSVLFPGILFYVYIIKMEHERLSLKQLLNMYDAFIICSLILALYNMTFGWPWFSRLFTISNAYGNETRSFLKSNHEFALYLIFGLIMCIFCIRKKREDKKATLKYYFYIFILAINLISTFSRSGILSFIFCILFTALFYNRKTFYKYILAVSGFILIVIVTPPLRTYIFDILMKGNEDAGRLSLMEYAFSVIKQLDPIHALFGIGYTKLQIDVFSALRSTSLHNSLLTILLNGGVMMLLFYVAVIISSISKAIECRKYDRYAGSMFLGLIALSLVFMSTNTPILFTSQVDSYTITMFVILIPRYYKNYVTSLA